MTEQTTEPRRHLALDTDWMTAVLGVMLFALCLLVVGAMAWSVLTGTPVKTQITWQRVFWLVLSAWLTVTVRARVARFAFGLLFLSIASQVVLALLHVSVATQTLNAEVMRVVELVIMIGFCLYMPYWFKERIKHV